MQSLYVSITEQDGSFYCNYYKTAKKTMQLLKDHAYKLHGHPLEIANGIDVRFTIRVLSIVPLLIRHSIE